LALARTARGKRGREREGQDREMVCTQRNHTRREGKISNQKSTLEIKTGKGERDRLDTRDTQHKTNMSTRTATNHKQASERDVRFSSRE
jgi:hypothetical protein